MGGRYLIFCRRILHCFLAASFALAVGSLRSEEVERSGVVRKVRSFRPISGSPNKPAPQPARVETGTLRIKAPTNGDDSEQLSSSQKSQSHKTVSSADRLPAPKQSEPKSAPNTTQVPPEKKQPTFKAPTKVSEIGGPLTLENLRASAHVLAREGLSYKFGCDSPSQGGMDCSGTIQYLLQKLGVKDIPRTSYDQYYWLKKKKLLDDVYGRRSQTKMMKKLAPGDLIFWGNTWRSGHRVSHVMIYMGYNPNNKKHYLFGAKGKSSKGMMGHGVDIFDMSSQGGRLIAHGKIPGLQY